MTKQAAATLESICNTIASYYTDANLDLVRKAYHFAEKAHTGQKRSSGEAYITHPTEIAQSLANMRLDLSSIITGLLHDTVEDTHATLEEIEKEFGKDVAHLVDGVTKLSKITFRTSEEKQAENFRKMIIAMAKDIRVILVKLADRLNNMQTLEHLAPPRQKAIAQETLDIYAPIANRLGMSQIKIELEDLCLKFLRPEVYTRLADLVLQSKVERQKQIDEFCETLKEKLKEYDMNAQVAGRAKHFYSIYNKMERRGVDYEQLHDIIAFRIVVDNITECYKALGVIHASYKPIPGRFKDYIAMPKANNYQSLHTTVIGPNGDRIEIQIRTQEMNMIAERGIAAHWQYKEGKFDTKSRENIDWVNRLLEWQKDLSDPSEFLETVKIDLFAEDVFVFTPRGEVKQLPHNSTPLDLAYSVHSEVGNKCIGAKVNGKIVPLKHRLKSGDTVEIITSPTQTPSKDWLKIVRSSRAKAKIRAFITLQERTRAKEIGRDLLEKGFKPFGLNVNRLEKSGELNKLLNEVRTKTMDELLIAVGYGRVVPADLAQKLMSKEDYDKKISTQDSQKEQPEKESFLKKVFKVAKRKSEARNAIIVEGLDDVLIRFARCCNPLPGDSIIGFITRGRGVTVHTSNCTKAIDQDVERRVDVKWSVHNRGSIKRNVMVRVLSQDEPGLLAMMSQTIAGCSVNIAAASVRTTKDKKAICHFELEVSDVEQLQKVTSALEAKRGVIAVERIRS